MKSLIKRDVIILRGYFYTLGIFFLIVNLIGYLEEKEMQEINKAFLVLTTLGIFFLIITLLNYICFRMNKEITELNQRLKYENQRSKR